MPVCKIAFRANIWRTDCERRVSRYYFDAKGWRFTEKVTTDFSEHSSGLSRGSWSHGKSTTTELHEWVTNNGKSTVRTTKGRWIEWRCFSFRFDSKEEPRCGHGISTAGVRTGNGPCLLVVVFLFCLLVCLIDWFPPGIRSFVCSCPPPPPPMF